MEVDRILSLFQTYLSALLITFDEYWNEFTNRVISVCNCFDEKILMVLTNVLRRFLHLS